jgi:glutathione S-transferase
MTLKLFELVGIDETRPFSPFCWRTRMALAHKGLDAESIPWRFTEKGATAPHGSEKVPVLLHGDNAVVDSWVIANYLEDTHPRPAVAVRGRRRPRLGPHAQLVGRHHRDRRHVRADRRRYPRPSRAR